MAVPVHVVAAVFGAGLPRQDLPAGRRIRLGPLGRERKGLLRHPAQRIPEACITDVDW